MQEAVQGKLVPQNKKDEPAPELLKKIKAEKEALVKAGKLKKEKPLPPIKEEEIPFELPEGWVWYRLGEVCLSSIAGKSLLCKEKTAERNEWGILKMSSISSGIFLENENKFLCAKLDVEPPYKIKIGDLIFARASGSRDLVGRSAIVKQISNQLLLNDKTIRFDFGYESLSIYIDTYNSTKFARNYYYTIIGNKTTTMNNITRSQFNELLIPLPLLSEQNRIVSKVQSLMAYCDALEAEVKKSKEESGRLMQAVLREAFGG